MVKKRILIIDDEDRIRTIYRRLFSAAGSASMDVLEASNAWDATEILLKNKVDLVLLDVNMPNIDGRDMCEVIREYDPNLKIIVASVYPEDKQRQMIPKASDYYDKSQGPFNLLEKVTTALV